MQSEDSSYPLSSFPAARRSLARRNASHAHAKVIRPLRAPRSARMSLYLAGRRVSTILPRSISTVQASMEKIKQGSTEEAYFRRMERERLDKLKLEKPQINENAPHLMKILEDEGVPAAMRLKLKTQLLLWKHEDFSRGAHFPQKPPITSPHLHQEFPQRMNPRK